jgi:hypothetical protein
MWEQAHIGREDDPFEIEGVSVWDARWQSTCEAVELPHPSYPNQRHRFSIYELESDGVLRRMAIAELSASVYGIYRQT